MGTLNDYRDREHWSYSALNQFLNICSLQYAFDRVYRLERAFTPCSLAFGSAYHRTLEWLHLTLKEGAVPTVPDARERFRDFWERQVGESETLRFDEGQDADSCAQQGAELIVAALEARDPEERVLTVSEAFAVPLVDARGEVLEKPMVGELDCRVWSREQTVIVDWKTSARRWPEGQADKSLQPTVYLYAHRQIHGQAVPMRFDVAVKNKKPVLEQHVTTRSSDQFLRMVELVKQAERMIAAEHFLPNESSFYCSGCPFQEPCRAWHRAARRTSVQPKAR